MKNDNVSRRNKFKSRKQAPANYLIVCEGKKTEPNYFNGLMKNLNKNGQAAERNPMTNVYKIVDGLKEYLE